jgi:hypothetical protein
MKWMVVLVFSVLMGMILLNTYPRESSPRLIVAQVCGQRHNPESSLIKEIFYLWQCLGSRRNSDYQLLTKWY